MASLKLGLVSHIFNISSVKQIIVIDSKLKFPLNKLETKNFGGFR